jgi:hypothetical protein
LWLVLATNAEGAEEAETTSRREATMTATLKIRFNDIIVIDWEDKCFACWQ